MKKASTSPLVYILLALAQRDLHGYGILQEVGKLSLGEWKLGPGTLYDNLRTLLADGSVSEFPGSEADGGKRMYHLTAAGASLLDKELRHLQDLVKAGQKRLRSRNLEGAR